MFFQPYLFSRHWSWRGRCIPGRLAWCLTGCLTETIIAPNTVRIPGGGGRVELRSADSACNPYLGMAMMIAAGLEGIRDELDPGEPHRENLYYKSDAERIAAGVAWLPRTLDEAVTAFAEDPLSREVFGGVMFDAWVEFKRAEWLSYLNHVSDWERDRYLKFF